MRTLSIGGCIGAGAVLLTAWMLVLAGQYMPDGDLGRGINVALFLGGTALLLAGIVLAVMTLRSAGRPGRR
jgi:hypothetical protein